jgi:hypothetical protein
MKTYIIIDLRKDAALYGINDYTLVFKTEDEALNIAKQFFSNDEDYLILPIKLRD